MADIAAHKIITFLMFQGQTEEAMAFYLPSAEIQPQRAILKTASFELAPP